MNTRHSCAVACAVAVLLAWPAAQAQLRKVAPSSPQPTRQAAPPGVATFGLPSPAGLAPPIPPSLSPGAAPGSPVTDAGVQQPLAPAGGGGGVVVVQQSAGGTSAMGAGPLPRGAYSATDIARAFMDADTNHDGELSRAEAQRLSIPLGASFDDLDRNNDGVLSRFEFEDAFR